MLFFCNDSFLNNKYTLTPVITKIELPIIIFLLKDERDFFFLASELTCEVNLFVSDIDCLVEV